MKKEAEPAPGTGTTTSTREYLAEPVRRSLINALSRIEGHVAGVRRMVEEQACCDEILIQAAAVKGAMNSVVVRLVEEELMTCVSTCGSDEGEQRLARAMTALSSMLKQG